MDSVSLKSCLTVVACLGLGSSPAEGMNLPGKGIPIQTENGSPSHENIARPVFYSFFSSADGSSAQFRPRTNAKISSEIENERSELEEPPRHRKSLKFPLNTVLPGNSIDFDHLPYPGLLRAVNTFSDLISSRQPQDEFVVTHNTISLPSKAEGVTAIASRTRITNGENGDAPFGEFTETTRNKKGLGGKTVERIRHLRLHQNIKQDILPTFINGESEKCKQEEDKPQRKQKKSIKKKLFEI